MSLLELQPGQVAHVMRVNDQDSEKLRYLGQLGLYPSARLELLERAPFGGPLRIRVGEEPVRAEQMLGAELAESIIVKL
jgi:DtxR family Mn-dependent transcriptional regulator